MALPTDVDEVALERVRRFCVERTPIDERSEIRLECSLRGNSITIIERRPPWSEVVGPEWTSMKIAQLRYDDRSRIWTLYCIDRNERWWQYGFVEQSGNVEELLTAIERALAHHQAARSQRSKLDVVLAHIAKLTPRERQVFDLVIRGNTNKQVAKVLGATERTIKAHRHRVMEKLQVQSLAELVSLAERAGILRDLSGTGSTN